MVATPGGAKRGLSFQFVAIGRRSARRTLISEVLAKQLDDYTRDFITDRLPEIANYPPQVPTSKYVRTFTLAEGWERRPIRHGADIGWQYTNNATDPRGRMYARYVHGPGVQPVGWQSRLLRSRGWKNYDETLQRNDFRRGAEKLILEGLTRAL